MPDDKRQILYNALKDAYDIGDFGTFTKKMDDPNKRKVLFDTVGKEFELGTYESFDEKMTQVQPPMTEEEVAERSKISTPLFARELEKNIAQPFQRFTGNAPVELAKRKAPIKGQVPTEEEMATMLEPDFKPETVAPSSTRVDTSDSVELAKRKAPTTEDAQFTKEELQRLMVQAQERQKELAREFAEAGQTPEERIAFYAEPQRLEQLERLVRDSGSLVASILDFPFQTVAGGSQELGKAEEAFKEGKYGEAGLRGVTAAGRVGIGTAMMATPTGQAFFGGEKVLETVSPEAAEQAGKVLAPVTTLTEPGPGTIQEPLAELGDVVFQMLAFGGAHKLGQRIKTKITEGKPLSVGERNVIRQQDPELLSKLDELQKPKAEVAEKPTVEQPKPESPVAEAKPEATPVKTEAVELPPSFRNKVIEDLKAKGIEETRFGAVDKLSDADLVRVAEESKVRTEAPKGEAPISQGGDISVRGEANAEQIRRFQERGKPIPPEVLKDYPELAKKKTETGVSFKGEQEPTSTAALKAKSDIQTSLEPQGTKSVKASEIISRASKELNVPIRIGHERFIRGVQGMFKLKPEVVRMKEANDLATMTHEVAHAIDKKLLGGFTKAGSKRFAGFADELGKLDYAYPKQKRTFEGFAEFVRHYLTADDAQTLAPKFYEHFQKEILGKNADLTKTIGGLKESITQWRQQGAEARVLSQIDFDNKARVPLKERAGDAWLKFKTTFSNDLEPLNYAVNEILKSPGVKLEARENPFAIATFVAKTAPAKARAFVLDGAFDFSGNKVGKSLKDVVAPVGKEMETAISYAYAQRALELHKRNINPGISKEDAQFVVNKNKSERYDTFTKEVTEWNGHLLDYLVDAGGLSPEAAAVIRESNTVYIPLKRVFVDKEPSFTQGRGFADLPSPVKRIKGSGREIQNPLESMIQQAEQIIAVADKARVARAIADLPGKQEGLGKWIEKVEPPTEVTRIGLEKLTNELKSQGIEVQKKLKPEDIEQIVTLFTQGSRYYGKDNIVSVYRNGKREFYEVHPTLFKAMKGLDKQTLPWLLNMTFGAASRAIRLGATGLRAGFTLITNPIRDAQTFALQREGGVGVPTAVWRGYQDIFGKGELRERFKRVGGEMAQPLGLDRRLVHSLVDEVLANSAKSKAMNVVKHPIEVLKNIFSFTESAPRLAEFESVWKKWQPQIDEALARGDNVRANQLRENANIEAGNAAADVTVNFRRMGTYSSILNQVIPFFNPGIQGNTKILRTIAQHPLRSAARAGANLTVPSLVLWWLNKDEDWYKNLPAWEKAVFWHFKIGDTIVRLPMPFGWGHLFAGIPVSVADAEYNENPEIIKEALGEALGSVMPDVLPGLVKPAGEAYFNWDIFRERPIVPESQQDLLESEQYLPHTSEVAKEIGKVLNISPAKLDHLLSGYTGGLATDILNALPKEVKEPADIPVIGRLFTRQDAIGFGGQQVRRFYDELERATKYKRTLDAYLKPKKDSVPDLQQIERAAEILKLDKDAAKYYSAYLTLNTTARRLKELRTRQRNLSRVEVDAGIRKQINEAVNKAAALLAETTLRGLRQVPQVAEEETPNFEPVRQE